MGGFIFGAISSTGLPAAKEPRDYPDSGAFVSNRTGTRRFTKSDFQAKKKRLAKRRARKGYA